MAAAAHKLAPTPPVPAGAAASDVPVSGAVTLPGSRKNSDARARALEDLSGSLRVLTCGSVDDGKSTLIGRLLWDASDLFEDQRASVAKSGRLASDGASPDFSLLVDGLAAEREQGITIDIAWRYFDWGHRRVVIIDSPGHEQYTRNMATGASHADVALMLVDARSGIKKQTRRHAAILELAGVKRVILAVNKMDLVGWSQERYRAIAADFGEIAVRLGFKEAAAVPVAAPTGDNVTIRSAHMPWYTGETILELLTGLPARERIASGPFRLPVQLVLRDGRDFRGLAGTVSSGAVKVGDTVRDSASGATARVQRIVTMDRDLKQAAAGQAVTLQLDRDLDIARGAVLASPAHQPVPAREVQARLVWMAETAFDPRAGYLLRSATDIVPVAGFELLSRLDLETLAAEPAGSAGVNDIVDARLSLARPLALDRFADTAGTGAVLVIDAITGATVAAGIVLAAEATPSAAQGSVFVLTRARLASGVCRDLGANAVDAEEFRRRAGEVAILMRSAGVTVRLDL